MVGFTGQYPFRLVLFSARVFHNKSLATFFRQASKHSSWIPPTCIVSLDLHSELDALGQRHFLSSSQQVFLLGKAVILVKMDHFVPQPPHALLVPKKGGTSLRLIDRPSWVPVAWQGGDSFVVADWDSALPQSFYFAFKAVHATEWSLAIPPKCISSVQERLTNTAVFWDVGVNSSFLDKWSCLYYRHVYCGRRRCHQSISG